MKFDKQDDSKQVDSNDNIAKSGNTEFTVEDNYIVWRYVGEKNGINYLIYLH